jgi:uncharacterized delta-60 repeat protein
MWTSFLSLCLALSGSAPTRPARRRQPPFRRPASRPRLEALEDRCLLSAGALDPTFGSGAGYVSTSITSGSDFGRSALIQPWDGKILAAGEAYTPNKTGAFHAMSVTRYYANGSLDTSFGSGGTAVAFNSQASSHLTGSAFYPRTGPDTADYGKIVVAGWTSVTSKKDTQTGFGVARFNANGTLDATFGSGGQVTTAFTVGPRADYASGVVVQLDGKIVVAGDSNFHNSFELVRYNANGTLDASFGSGGKVVTPFAQYSNLEAATLLLQPDGKLIVVGDDNNSNQAAPADWVLARYNSDGSLDTSFGNNGVATTVLPGEVGSQWSTGKSAALYPSVETSNDGKIVVVGDNGKWELVRFNTDGSPDASFGPNHDGRVLSQLSGSAASVALDASDRMLVVGTDNTSNSSQVARFNLDGTLDTTFGSGGFVNQTFGTSSQGEGIAIYPNAGTANDGKIVVVGVTSNGTKNNILVARYLPSEPQIGSFTSSTSTVTSGSSVMLTASNITDANPNSTVAQVTFYYYDSNGNRVTLGTVTTGSGGAWTLNYTVTLASGTYTLYAQAEDSYNVLGDPIALTLTVQ